MKRLFPAALCLVLLTFSAQEAAAADRCGAPASDSLVKTLVRQAPGLQGDVLRLALDARSCAAERGLLRRPNILTVIDYSIPSVEPRLFVFDLQKKKLLYRELVAHGKNSGGNLTKYFSNSHGSLATSIGLFVTADTYIGSNGYSLRLRGLERGVNDQAMNRAIVMHGASYVSRVAINALGRLGRSWGCPAVRKEIARKLIDTVKGGSPIFAYYPDEQWLSASTFVPRVYGTQRAAAKSARMR